MAQLVLVALAALAAAGGYREAARFSRERRRDFMAVPPLGWGSACGLAGLIGAVFMPAFVLGALSGLVGYHESRKLAEQWREAPFGLPVPGWVLGCAVFGFGGAVLTSTAFWLVACGYLALVGALLLVIEERNTLADGKCVLLAENRRLRDDKSLRSGGVACSSSISPRSFRTVERQQLDGTEAQSHTRDGRRPNSSTGEKAYLFGDPKSQRRVTRSVPIPWTRCAGSTPASRAGNGTDFLPRRSPRRGLWWRVVDPRKPFGRRDDEIRARVERVAAEFVAESAV